MQRVYNGGKAIRMKIDILQDTLFVIIQMPTDGKEITKNNKYLSIGGGRKITNPALKAWYEEALLSHLHHEHKINAWIQKMNCKLYNVKIFWSLKSYRTDAQNFNEMLLDYLEKLLGINDRNLLPSIVGKEKNGVATAAHVGIERHAGTTLKEFGNSCQNAWD